MRASRRCLTSPFERPDLVIEKFMPEVEPDGYAARFWSFCGDAERCTRYVSPHPLVKAEDTIRSEKVPVPDEMRALRERLGFDYGKFDFVVHAGKPVLLDANKTPGRLAQSIRGAESGGDPSCRRFRKPHPQQALKNHARG